MLERLFQEGKASPAGETVTNNQKLFISQIFFNVGLVILSTKSACRFHIYHLLLDIKDDEDETFLKVQGPCCACRCCTEMNFDVRTATQKREDHTFDTDF